MKESGIFPSENCSFSSQNYSIDFDYENYKNTLHLVSTTVLHYLFTFSVYYII